jgi:uncharacterized membrane protein HdeD (DUF308 family)
MFVKTLSQYWWILLLRGTLALLFGLGAFAMPGITLASLVLLFAEFAFADGIVEVYHAFRVRRDNEQWWVLLLEGLLGITFGIITFQAPNITTLVLLIYIAAWAIASGVMRIVLAIQVRKEIEGEWMLALGGLASLLFGVFMIARPGAGALAVIWVIGAWAILIGLFLIVLAFQAKGLGQKLDAGVEGRIR